MHMRNEQGRLFYGEEGRPLRRTIDKEIKVFGQKKTFKMDFQAQKSNVFNYISARTSCARHEAVDGRSRFAASSATTNQSGWRKYEHSDATLHCWHCHIFRLHGHEGKHLHGSTSIQVGLACHAVMQEPIKRQPHWCDTELIIL